jgi:hypothetical protein
MLKERIPLSCVPSELRREHGAEHTYRKVYNGVLDGVVPAQQTNGCWHVGRSDLPAIAKALSHKTRRG